MSLMRQQQQRYYAQQNAAIEKQQDKSAWAKAYKKWMVQRIKDQAALKVQPNHDKRGEIAATLINHYLPYLRDWLSHIEKQPNAAHQNDVLTQAVIWAVDGERWDVLFELADPAIANEKVGVLHWFNRTLPQFVADGVLKAAEKEYEKSGDVTKAPINEILSRIDSEKWQVNAPSFARWHKFFATIAEKKQDWDAAYKYFAIAHKTYKNISVKGRMEAAEKHLKNKNKNQIGDG